MPAPSGIMYYDFAKDPTPIYEALKAVFADPTQIDNELKEIAAAFGGRQMLSSLALLGKTINTIDHACEENGTSKALEILLDSKLKEIVAAIASAAAKSWPREAEQYPPANG